MSNRVTEKQLQDLCARINREIGSPAAPYTRNADGNLVGQVGNYQLSYADGGVSLHRLINERGGASDVFECGHIPKRDLANRMHAFLIGLDSA